MTGCLGLCQVTVLDASKADLAAFRHGWEAGRCLLQKSKSQESIPIPLAVTRKFDFTIWNGEIIRLGDCPSLCWVTTDQCTFEYIWWFDHAARFSFGLLSSGRLAPQNQDFKYKAGFVHGLRPSVRQFSSCQIHPNLNKTPLAERVMLDSSPQLLYLLCSGTLQPSSLKKTQDFRIYRWQLGVKASQTISNTCFQPISQVTCQQHLRGERGFSCLSSQCTSSPGKVAAGSPVANRIQMVAFLQRRFPDPTSPQFRGILWDPDPTRSRYKSSNEDFLPVSGLAQPCGSWGH